ncbi:TetR/AcrR family transcriptional regulator [Chryseobacterium taichungense]|uniref:TetR/AcrR family transcriptional regulator n=1 Tax=Chryseobacterium taichungense TaxID=295069 RepID=UPI0028ABB138|nr:TetR/AcrR family transcriptional regulator [Chryseobacterium taichungense]
MKDQEVNERRDTKETILKIAVKLFSRNGYEQTSIRDIANEANINCSTINYHFESKENLLVTILQDLYVSIASIDELSENNTEEKSQLEHYIRSSVQELFRLDGISLLFISEQVHASTPKTRQLITQMEQAHFYRFCKIMDTQRTQLKIKKSDRDLLYHSIFGLVKQMIIKGRRRERSQKHTEKCTVDDIMDYINNNIL